jgi:hypothetical protein
MMDTNLERVLPKNQHTQNKLLNWCSGGQSKIGHHFSKEDNKEELRRFQ